MVDSNPSLPFLTELQTASEAQLVGAMVLREGPPDLPRRAWAELYRRHVRYVFAVVKRSYRTFIRDECLPDFVVDTFRHAFQWASHQADAEEITCRFTGPTPDATRRKVLAWLGTIAERVVADKLRQLDSRTEISTDYLDQLCAVNVDQNARLDPKLVATLQAALDSLSHDEALALRVSLPWYDMDSQSFAVPSGEAMKIADSLGVQPGTLRQRRHRALRHIEAKLRTAGWPPREEGGLS